MRWVIACFFILVLVSCRENARTQTGAIQIRLAADSQSVCLTGLDYHIIYQLKTDSLTAQTWQNLFAVYRMPADTDMKDIQPAQPGHYTLTDTSVIFKPDTAFAKHQTYFVRFYGGGPAQGHMHVLQGGAKIQGQHYREMVFKF